MREGANVRKPESTGPGRPRKPNGYTHRGALTAAVLKESVRLFQESTGLLWMDVEADARAWIAGFKERWKLAIEEQRLCEKLLATCGEVRDLAARRDSGFAQWVRSHLIPALEAGADTLHQTAAPLPRTPDTVITQVVEALDRTNFLARLDRAATDQEMAVLALLLGAQMSPAAHPGRSVRVEEVIAAATQAVIKAREKRGRPHLIEKFRKEMDDILHPLRWIEEMKQPSDWDPAHWLDRLNDTLKVK